MAMCSMTDRPRLDERYRTAVSSSNLGSDPKTFRSDSDVLGAMALADRRLTDGWVTTGPGEGYRIPASPLSVALERLFSGDNHAATALVEILSAMLWGKAESERVKPRIGRTLAREMAQAILAWHRSGICKPCNGHGYELVPGAPMLSDRQCVACGGSAKMPLEKQFDPGHREMARWLLGEIARAAGRAGPEAIRALVPRLEL